MPSLLVLWTKTNLFPQVAFCWVFYPNHSSIGFPWSSLVHKETFLCMFISSPSFPHILPFVCLCPLQPNYFFQSEVLVQGTACVLFLIHSTFPPFIVQTVTCLYSPLSLSNTSWLGLVHTSLFRVQFILPKCLHVLFKIQAIPSWVMASLIIRMSCSCFICKLLLLLHQDADTLQIASFLDFQSAVEPINDSYLRQLRHKWWLPGGGVLISWFLFFMSQNATPKT